MSWNTLGIISVSPDWQLFDQPSFSSLFRVTFLGDLDRVWYSARIRQYYATDEVSQSIKLYPKNESLIIQIAIPEELQALGLSLRYLGVKKIPYRRNTVLDSAWQIKLEELQ